MSEQQFPTPLEIKALAEDYGYDERRPEASCTLFFKESNTSSSSSPTLINIFYTTRGIMTKLPHPTQGYNSLWRSSAYDSLETLAMLFETPRAHTGKGYRQAKDAVRGCGKCGDQKRREECYSANQWRAGPGKSVCSECVGAGKVGGGGRGKNKENGGGNINNNNVNTRAGIVNNGNGKGGDHGGFPPLSEATDSNNANNGSSSFPRLSEDVLQQHNRQTTSKVKLDCERRQFNCPVCPKEGRGKHVFFKKVPAEKPIVKCPKCKRAKQKDCERLYPIPKGEEKGYGHYRCHKCTSTWGSSRAITSIGQQCHVCALDPNIDNHEYVRPFRVEAYRSGRGGGIAGGGARPAGRGNRRKPRESIPEDEEAQGAYCPNDGSRFHNPGNALLGPSNGNGGGGGGGGVGFDWEQVDSPEMAPARSRLSQYKPAHKCEGCATGLCRSRKLPISGLHDVHDGNTVSTSGSIVTNSEIDKGDYADRDVDFDDWEEEDESEVWVTMGKSGKMLRG